MEKDILFTGITAAQSDYDCSDGELAQSYNLLNEDGAMRPILSPKLLLTLADNEKVVFIHHPNANVTHYIVHDTSSGALRWLDEDGTTGASLSVSYMPSDDEDSTSKKLYGVNAIGNTLLLLTSEGVMHLLWKAAEGGTAAYYKVLGTHIPELDMNFGLQFQFASSEDWQYSYLGLKKSFKDADMDWNDATDETGQYTNLVDDAYISVTNASMGLANKWISDFATNHEPDEDDKKNNHGGRFCQPFLVRYALRLYDDSYVMHSCPVLMMVSSSVNPFVVFQSNEDADETTDGSMNLTKKDTRFNNNYYGKAFGVVADLDYCLSVNGQLATLKEWGDIVKSVDVFVSAPLYTFKPGENVTRIINQYTTQSKSAYNEVAKRFHVGCHPKTDSSQYRRWSQCPISVASRYIMPDLNARTDGEMRELFENCQNFYLLKSFNLEEDELVAGSQYRTIIEIEHDYLQSLTSRRTLTDDWNSHDQLIPQYAHAYNKRINYAVIAKQLWNNYNATNLFQHTSGLGTNYTSNETTYIVLFFIKEGNKESVVVGREGTYRYFLADASGESDTIRGVWTMTYLYYPNPNCYYAVVLQKHYSGGYYHTFGYKMEPHAFLSGAVCVKGVDTDAVVPTANFLTSHGFTCDQYSSITAENFEAAIAKLTDRTVDEPSKIYTSDVNNPFRFDVTNINTIGTGRIVGLSSAAQALSQGQFGQFPLYAFTDEGVWAMSVSSTGGFSTVQPITRDVCIDARSITQIDNSVLFATDRGIMEIGGSQASCITDIINGRDFFALDRLPGLSSLYSGKIPQINCTFAEYRKDARISYDYTGQRIIVFSPGKGYAYVFSLKSKLWGIMASTLTAPVNAYPDAYAMAGNCLVDLSHSTATSATGLLVTRPFTLDEASVFKTINSVFMRGMFPRGSVQVVLYGSRDNINWHLIHSAQQHYLRGFRGSPYKSFRLVAVTSLATGQALTGASITYDRRLTNQLR